MRIGNDKTTPSLLDGAAAAAGPATTGVAGAMDSGGALPSGDAPPSGAGGVLASDPGAAGPGPVRYHFKCILFGHRDNL